MNQSSSQHEGRNNPRNNPRQHQKPTPRRTTASSVSHVTSQGAQSSAQVGAQSGAANANNPRLRAHKASASTPHMSAQAHSAAGAQQAMNNQHAASAQQASAPQAAGAQQASAPQAAGAQQVGTQQATHSSTTHNPRMQVSNTQADRISRPQATAHNSGYAPVSYGTYGDRSHYKAQKKKPSKVAGVLLLALAACVAVGVYFIVNPPSFNVTINGMEKTVNRGFKLSEAASEYANPKAGNFLAVDGSVIEEGGGTKFTGTINGNEVTDLDTELHKGDTVQISDGTDVTEDYDVETSEIQPEQKEVGTGAIHVYVPGEATQIETRTGKVSGKTVQETVKEGVDSTYLKYEADTGDDKVIALTFDDGPWNTTEEVLDILKANGAKATFFTIGEQISDVDNYTDVIQRMASEGHQIATHSYDHASTGGGNGVDMTRQSAEKQIEEVVDGQKAISDATGEEASKVFRSPGGNYSGDIIWNLEPYVTAEIGWDIDTMDWSRPGVDSIVQSILSADSGDIILMHDGGGDRSQTVEALKQALPQLVAQGYKFVTIDELLAYNDAKEIVQNLESSESSS